MAASSLSFRASASSLNGRNITALKVAASRIGITFDEYVGHIELGEKFCSGCKAWHPRDAFPRDRSRYDGLHPQCFVFRRVDPSAKPTALDRFLVKVGAANERGCTEWLGGKCPEGYGTFQYNGRVQGAHRVAWQLFRGPITDGLWVLHKCDNPPCVNVDHLFLGTRQDNVDDMDAKGRRVSLPGELAPRAKLTAAQVEYIRSVRGVVIQRILAAEFGVSKTAIRYAQTGRNWREFPGKEAV